MVVRIRRCTPCWDAESPASMGALRAMAREAIAEWQLGLQPLLTSANGWLRVPRPRIANEGQSALTSRQDRLSPK